MRVTFNVAQLVLFLYVRVCTWNSLSHVVSLSAGPVGVAVKECRGAAELSAREFARVHFRARHSAE